MKWITLILSLALLVACSQREVPAHLLVERDDITYEVNSDTPFTGTSFEYWKGGDKLTVSYKDGVMHGRNELRNSAGQLKQSAEFYYGVQHGNESGYYDGELIQTMVWNHGEEVEIICYLDDEEPVDCDDPRLGEGFDIPLQP